MKNKELWSRTLDVKCGWENRACSACGGCASGLRCTGAFQEAGCTEGQAAGCAVAWNDRGPLLGELFGELLGEQLEKRGRFFRDFSVASVFPNPQRK